jgi:hypothetical protein
MQLVSHMPKSRQNRLKAAMGTVFTYAISRNPDRIDVTGKLPLNYCYIMIGKSLPSPYFLDLHLFPNKSSIHTTKSIQPEISKKKLKIQHHEFRKNVLLCSQYSREY